LSAESKEQRDGYQKCLDVLDHELCHLLGQISVLTTNRARKSQSANLIGMAACFGALPDLAEFLPRVPDSEWDDPETSDCLGFWLLENLSQVIRFLERDALVHPERYRLWAREQPALPMMVFRNVRAYRRRFEQVATAVKLGQRCPINSDKRANYDLSRSVNQLVFDALMEFMRVLDFLNEEKPAWKGKTPEQVLTELADVPANQVEIFLAAHQFGAQKPLTKKHAYEWAYKFIIPFLEREYPDWQEVPALRPYLRSKGGRAKAKEVIAERLEGMARPESPGNCHSSRWPS